MWALTKSRSQYQSDGSISSSKTIRNLLLCFYFFRRLSYLGNHLTKRIVRLLFKISIRNIVVVGFPFRFTFISSVYSLFYRVVIRLSIHLCVCYISWASWMLIQFSMVFPFRNKPKNDKLYVLCECTRHLLFQMPKMEFLLDFCVHNIDVSLCISSLFYSI